jgi:hypothetical protein
MVADYITDKLFKKPPEKIIQYSGNLSKFTGIYKGPGRGDEMTLVITKKDSTIAISSNGNNPGSLNYLEDNMWTDGYSTFQFVGIQDSISELRIDNVYAYSILKKEK